MKMRKYNKEYSKDYYKNNKKKRIEYQVNWNKKNKARCQTPKGKFNQYKGKAKQREKEFQLTKKQFMSFWQKPCSYCGSEIKTIGLDRIDNKKGYTIDNVVSCCIICNKMKMCQTQKQFINQCKKIVNFLNSCSFI